MYHVRLGLPLLSARVLNLRRRNLPSGRRRADQGNERKSLAYGKRVFAYPSQFSFQCRSRLEVICAQWRADTT